MNYISRTPRPAHLLLPLALLLSGLALSATAEARPKAAPVGTWAGTATYVSPPDDRAPGIEYESSIVLSTSRDRQGVVRLSGLIATVRTYCLSAIRDIRIVKPTINRGPKLTQAGSFSYSTKGVTVSGRLGRPNGNGSIVASAGPCDLKDGTWKAQKRKY